MNRQNDQCCLSFFIKLEKRCTESGLFRGSRSDQIESQRSSQHESQKTCGYQTTPCIRRTPTIDPFLAPKFVEIRVTLMMRPFVWSKIEGGQVFDQGAGKQSRSKSAALPQKKNKNNLCVCLFDGVWYGSVVPY